MLELVWTSEPPTEPGAYGLVELDENDGVVGVHITLEPESLTPIVWFPGSSKPCPVYYMKNCRWAGPIPEPREA